VLLEKPNNHLLKEIRVGRVPCTNVPSFFHSSIQRFETTSPLRTLKYWHVLSSILNLEAEERIAILNQIFGAVPPRKCTNCEQPLHFNHTCDSDAFVRFRKS
jgi:hypothetical protein